MASYSKLRKYIQVPQWQPHNHVIEDAIYETWDFNKSAFEDENRIPRDYAKHLDGAAEQAVEMRKAFQRFQLVAELHLFEIPLSFWLLKRRFKAVGI